MDDYQPDAISKSAKPFGETLSVSTVIVGAGDQMVVKRVVKVYPDRTINYLSDNRETKDVSL